MKSYLNVIGGLAALTAFASTPVLLAADIITSYPYPAPANNSYTPPQYSSPASIAASASNMVMVALNAQVSLLKDLAQEHLSRAAELTQNNQTQKAQWETDLVNELQEKSQRVQKSIDQMSQPGTGVGDMKAGNGNGDDELVFMSTVDARLAQVRQDLSAAIGDTRAMSLQISTNKSPESIAAMSSVVTDNQKLVKELQREELDLELRKLEFRALRKAMQK